MRRGSVCLGSVTLVLVLSHGAAWWLGSAFPEGPATSSNRSTGPAAAGPAPWSTAELLRRGRERDAALEAKADAEQQEEDRPYAERLAEARAKIPPGTDLRDYLAKAIASRKRGEEIDMQAIAAFGMWLERDPAAAVEWAGLTDRDTYMKAFTTELAHWLDAGECRQLGDLYKRFPLAKSLLLDAAKELAGEREPAQALAVAAAVPDPGERLRMIDAIFSGEEEQSLKGHVAAVRAMLGEKECYSFLSNVLDRDGPQVQDLLDEIRAAGFSAELLAKFEQAVEQKREFDREKEKEKEERSQEEEHESNQEIGLPAMNDWVPDFEELESSITSGRLAPEESIALIAATWPVANTPEGAAEIRERLAGYLSHKAPLEMLRWLRESGTQEQWRKQLADCLGYSGYLKPEQIEGVIAELPAGTELGERERDSITAQFREWFDKDPDGYLAAAQRIEAEDEKEGLDTRPLMHQLMLAARDSQQAYWKKRWEGDRQDDAKDAKIDDPQAAGDDEEEEGKEERR